MKNQVSILLIASAAAFTTNVWASEDGSYTNYDAIVSELRASAEDRDEPKPVDLNWDEVSLHVGMAFVDTVPSVKFPNGSASFGMMNGFEVHAGANLFSKKVRGEIAFRNYLPADNGMGHLKLRELQARVLALPPINENNLLRMGFGLGARYMELDFGSEFSGSTTTPAASLILGFEHRFTHSISLGPDIAYYSPMSTTFDKSGFDGAIRLNATF